MSNNYKTYISIGNCFNPTWFLRKQLLRTVGFPFHWCITSLTSALTLIQNRFQGFFEESNFVYLPKDKRILLSDSAHDESETFIDDYITPVYDKRNNIMYVHDFGEHGKADYSRVKDKYHRRVNRLLDLLDSGKQIEFVYENNPLNDWQLAQYKKVGVEFKLFDELSPLSLSGNQSANFISLEQLKASLL